MRTTKTIRARYGCLQAVQVVCSGSVQSGAQPQRRHMSGRNDADLPAEGRSYAWGLGGAWTKVDMRAWPDIGSRLAAKASVGWCIRLPQGLSNAFIDQVTLC